MALKHARDTVIGVSVAHVYIWNLFKSSLELTDP